MTGAPTPVLEEDAFAGAGAPPSQPEALRSAIREGPDPDEPAPCRTEMDSPGGERSAQARRGARRGAVGRRLGAHGHAELSLRRGDTLEGLDGPAKAGTSFTNVAQAWGGADHATRASAAGSKSKGRRRVFLAASSASMHATRPRSPARRPTTGAFAAIRSTATENRRSRRRARRARAPTAGAESGDRRRRARRGTPIKRTALFPRARPVRERDDGARVRVAGRSPADLKYDLVQGFFVEVIRHDRERRPRARRARARAADAPQAHLRRRRS